MKHLLITSVEVGDPELTFDLLSLPRPDGLGLIKAPHNMKWEGEVTFRFVSSGDMSGEDKRSIRNKIAKFLLENSSLIEL